ncbi:MAG: hypothetical protein C0501_24475 [Isosphaera sp.]|nr:hypothetical protein [Isosphaera sp.]
MFRAAAAVLAAGACGCGPADGLARVPVSGRVTAGGRPVDGALVRFVPTGGTKGYGASARTAADGSFVLADDRGHRGGVVPGAYKVAVNRPARPDGSPLPPDTSELDFPDARESMPRRVASADLTPLAFTVPEAGGEAVIDIPAELFAEKRPKGPPPVQDPGVAP